MKFIRFYLDSFKGLSKEIWYLALVTLINRAGTMVTPFLTIYLKNDKNFSLQDIAWVMSAFGFGSIVGAWIGGKLTKKIGFYYLMFSSLLLTGIAFFLVQYVNSFWGFCAGIFVLMLIADAFRPASYVAIDAFSSPENKTRSVSLLRLAINLGFSFGPALGGLIIIHGSYSGLFWIDGITCISAAFLFLILLNNKVAKVQKQESKAGKQHSPYADKSYLLLMFCVFLIAFTFLQFFSTIPLYYKEIHHLDEFNIGLLFFLNGIVIFLVEMPLIKYLEKPSLSVYKIVYFSLILLILCFLVLNLFSWVGILTISMIFLTFGEIFNFPFLNSLAIKRAKRGNMGEYMALYTMAFSFAHILGHNTGLQLVKSFGFNFTWYFMVALLLVCFFLLIWHRKISKKETDEL